MIAARAEVFDEIITGTSTTWYTSSVHNAALGQSDLLGFIAEVTNVSGLSPGLSAWIDLSGDNRNWFLSQTPGGDLVIPDPLLVEGAMAQTFRWTGGGPFARLRIVLTGTSPQCRLRVCATSRLMV